MKIKLFTLLFFISLLACETKPEGIISEDKMASILEDFYIMNASSVHFSMDEKYSNSDINHWIYQKHGVDSLEFAKSFKYYSKNEINTYVSILEKTQNKIQTKKDSIKK